METSHFSLKIGSRSSTKFLSLAADADEDVDDFSSDGDVMFIAMSSAMRRWWRLAFRSTCKTPETELHLQPYSKQIVSSQAMSYDVQRTR